MNTSASTRSGRKSEILRTAASPFPTAITSIPWSFRARPTIFCMLLLSSATKILATERSSGRYRYRPHTTANRIGAFGPMRVNAYRKTVCRKVYTLFPNAQRTKKQKGEPQARLFAFETGVFPKLPGKDFFQPLLFLAAGFLFGIFLVI